MGEGTSMAAPKQFGRRQSTGMMILGGAVAAVVLAGVFLQVSRPTPAFPGDANTPKAGAASVGGEQPKQQRALAKVGKQYITWDEVANEAVTRHGEEILDNMINRLIIMQACQQYGVEVTEAEVDAEIVKISKKFGLDTQQWLQMLQAERGVTIPQYKRDIIWPMLALRKLAGENIQLKQDDMQKAFQRNYGPRVKAKAIVLDNPRRATEVWEKARQNPDDFGRLARTHSIDPASRPLDGAIPPIRMYGGAPELEKVAFKLKPGEISAVIQVGVNQFVILQCEGFTDQVVTDIAEVESILKQELHEEKTNEAVAETFKKLKDGARVDNYLTRQSTGGTPKASNAAPLKDPSLQPVGATSPATARKPAIPAAPARTATGPATRTAP
jgi:foldase protein PrsA